VFWLAIWIFDSTAYLWGRFLGQEKFAPFISPGKNLEGFVFGYITTVLGCVLLSVWLKEPLFNVFGIVIPLAGISGDLLESWAKRVVGVKDSGKLIPYHGGVWDRLIAPYWLFWLFCDSKMALKVAVIGATGSVGSNIGSNR